MTLPDLRGLFAMLVAGDVEFVVIGGIALGIHGVIRTTEDLDIVPDPAPANVDRLCEVLQEAQAKLLLNPSRRFGEREAWMLRRGRNISLSTRHGDIDVVRNLPGVPAYEALVADAERFEIDGMALTVASRAALTAMKRARGSTQDQADIESLNVIDQQTASSADDMH